MTTRKQTAKQAAFWFFYRNAGFSYNPETQTLRQGKAETARRLAKAECEARSEGYTFSWTNDWSVGSHVQEFDCYDHEPDSCELCTMYDSTGEIVQVLGCIDDATREYRRVVEAELALEQIS